MSIANLRQRLGINTVKQSGQPVPEIGPVTILKHCRCIDCHHWIETRIKTYLCQKLIPVSGTPEQWHWCACYRGPQISKEAYVWKYDKTA